MAETHSDEYLARKMSRAEYWKLSDEEIEERMLAQRRIYSRKYYQENTEKYKERDRKYREENPEYFKEYNQTPNIKKYHAILKWTSRGLQETPDEMDRIYELRETQECCSSCGCILTRDGDRSSTQACLDHCHITHRFRQICCKNCNNFDNWKKFWVDGIYGGRRI